MTDSEFLSAVKANSSLDLPKIEKALNFAKSAHRGQKRFSGEDFYVHVLETAGILLDWKMDSDSVVAGLLHDSVEDGGASFEAIEKQFGTTVKELVTGVTKVGKLQLRGSTEEKFVENLRKMFLAMSRDLRVVIIKLADRLHNMRTLQYVPQNKQKRIARETIDVYAPLAERLGMGEAKGELEDLAFPFLYPEDYKWLVSYSGRYYEEANSHLAEVKNKLLRHLAQEEIKATISGRKKHLYSLYKKLLRPEINKDITLIHDIVALRIVVDEIEDCYSALGVVHRLFKPIPSLGVSDYIALPKPNGYRSIHTRVFGPKGHAVEIQIRTKEMHEQAEFGIAAHWHYASVKNTGKGDKILNSTGTFAPVEKLSWVKQLALWQGEVRTSQEFINALKFDALSQRIFVFTPKGDVKDLPLGATPIDFAYALHTELGDRTTGCKVNGKMVGFDYKLKSGEICEVMLSKEPRKPKQDWLKFVVTNLAKREILKGLRAAI